MTRLLPALAICAITPAWAVAQGTEPFQRLRQWVAASPIGQARPDAARWQRLHLDLIGATLEQAARRAESGQVPAEELEAVGRLTRQFDPALTRQLESVRDPRRATAPKLRAAAAAFAKASQDQALPRSQIVTANDPEPPLRMAPDSAKPLPIRAAGSAPRQAELDEDTVVLLTPEIRSRAAAFGNDPAQIFAFVYNNIELEFYPGALQNSLAVLWSGRASDLDQSTLLIALLRAAGVPARYVFGSIQITNTQLMARTGARNLATARAIAGLASPLQASGNNATIDHAWVEAFIGGDYVTLDPSFKTHIPQPGLAIPRLPFNRDAYLNSVKPFTAGEAYLDQIRQYLQQNNPGVALSDLPYNGPIQPVRSDVPPPAPSYTVTRVLRRVASIDKSDMHRVALTGRSTGGATTYFNTELFLPEISLKSLSLSSTAPGGAVSPQTGTGAFRPQLYLDNTVIAEGTAALPVNTTMELRVQYFSQGRDVAAVDVIRSIPPGLIFGVPVYAFHGPQYLSYRINRLLASNPSTADTGQSIREILHIIGVRYLQVWTEAGRAMAEPLQIAALYPRGQFGFTLGAANSQRDTDRPLMVTSFVSGMDIQGAADQFLDLNSADAATPELRDFRRTVGLTSSTLEHQVLEEMTLLPSASTTKVFQVAGEQHVPILTIPRATVAADLAPLPYTAAQKAELLAVFSNPRPAEIVLPARIITINNIPLFVYVREDDLGAGAYVIEGGASGELDQTPALQRPIPGSKNGGETDDTPCSCDPKKHVKKGTNGKTSGGTTVDDPVDVSNGNMFYESTDLAVPARGFPVVFTRAYNSQSSDIGPFGLGWTHSYNMSLRIGPASVDFFNPSGATYTLTKQGIEYASILRLGLRLRQDGTDYVLRDRNGFQWRFDAQGKLRLLIDTNGNTQTLAYNAAGKLTSVTDPAGRQLTLTYDSRNRITAVQDYSGRRSTYVYDAGDHLTEWADLAGSRTSYTYYAGDVDTQNMRTITDPEGNTTTFLYYVNDTVFKTIHPTGGQVVFFYLPLRQTTVTIDDRGFSTTYEYDGDGRVTRTVDPDGNSVTATFDANGLLLEAGDQAGSASRFQYDSAGNPAVAVDPLGNTSSFTYEPVFNRVTSVTDPRGNVTRAEYDARGNLTKLADATGAVSTLSYDQAGNLTGVTDADGKTSTFGYDGNGLLTQASDPLGNSGRVDRDPLGRPTRLTNPLGDSGALEYDVLDRLVRTASPLGLQNAFGYDRIGRLTQVADPNQSVYRFTYDGLDNLTSAALPTGDLAQYLYAPPDCNCSASSALLTTAVNAMGAASTFTYNHRGQPVEMRNAVGDITRYTYDGRGNLVQTDYPDGAFVHYSYDLNGLLVERLRSDNARDTFAYDAAGNVISASNPNVTYTFTYDERNRLASALDSRYAAPIRYQYDTLGRVAQMTNPQGGATDYTYDARGLVSAIRNPAGLTTSFSYDAAGRRSEVVFANGTKAGYRWDSDGRLLSLTYTAGDAVLNQFSYEYDGAGNRMAMTDSAGRHEYSYDASHRLTAATHPDQPAESYAYDAVGNRISSHRDASLTYDAENRLDGAGGAPFTYDRRGSQTARGSLKFTYNTLRSLNRVDRDNGVVLYRYDPFGRRVEKSVNGTVTRYLYDGESILQEYDTANRLAAGYTYGPGVDEPLIMQRGQAYFYQRDGLGSVRALADAGGKVIEQYRYDSFGNLAQADASAPPSAVGNPFLFTGREWDAEIGLYYYRARHYDPSVGRFLQTDALWNPASPETLNRYVYVANNPVNFVDPSGYKRIVELKAERDRVKAELAAHPEESLAQKVVTDSGAAVVVLGVVETGKILLGIASTVGLPEVAATAVVGGAIGNMIYRSQHDPPPKPPTPQEALQRMGTFYR